MKSPERPYAVAIDGDIGRTRYITLQAAESAAAVLRTRADVTSAEVVHVASAATNLRLAAE